MSTFSFQLSPIVKNEIHRQLTPLSIVAAIKANVAVYIWLVLHCSCLPSQRIINPQIPSECKSSTDEGVLFHLGTEKVKSFQSGREHSQSSVHNLTQWIPCEVLHLLVHCWQQKCCLGQQYISHLWGIMLANT